MSNRCRDLSAFRARRSSTDLDDNRSTTVALLDQFVRLRNVGQAVTRGNTVIERFLMQRVFDEPAAIRVWTRMLVTYAGLMLRIAAASAPEDPPTTPGFEVYEPGQIIIRQGEQADYVYNMSSGVAEVLVDDVDVARIGEGEIFGAMAVLTRTNRSATVRARTECSVVKVPKEQFTELIKSNPATIHSLLVDMANSIVNLNEQLVGLRGNQNTG